MYSCRKKNSSILSLGLGGVTSKSGEAIMPLSSGLIKHDLLLLCPVLLVSPPPSVEKEIQKCFEWEDWCRWSQVYFTSTLVWLFFVSVLTLTYLVNDAEGALRMHSPSSSSSKPPHLGKKCLHLSPPKERVGRCHHHREWSSNELDSKSKRKIP